jgi:hypothetical protein
MMSAVFGVVVEGVSAYSAARPYKSLVAVIPSASFIRSAAVSILIRAEEQEKTEKQLTTSTC